MHPLPWWGMDWRKPQSRSYRPAPNWSRFRPSNGDNPEARNSQSRGDCKSTIIEKLANALCYIVKISSGLCKCFYQANIVWCDRMLYRSVVCYILSLTSIPLQPQQWVCWCTQWAAALLGAPPGCQPCLWLHRTYARHHPWMSRWAAVYGSTTSPEPTVQVVKRGLVLWGLLNALFPRLTPVRLDGNRQLIIESVELYFHSQAADAGPQFPLLVELIEKPTRQHDSSAPVFHLRGGYAGLEERVSSLIGSSWWAQGDAAIPYSTGLAQYR